MTAQGGARLRPSRFRSSPAPGSSPRCAQCDQGSNAYCAIELVVVNGGYDSSDILVRAERRLLKKDGWSLAHGDTGGTSAANSPGHKLRLTFSTAAGDLQEIDLGGSTGRGQIVYALSSSMFARAAAMSMMLEIGSS